MTLGARDRRALLLLAPAVAALGIYYLSSLPGAGPAAPSATNPELLRQRVARLRQMAATAPDRETAMKEATALLAAREQGILQADTAPQAQAALLEIARRVGKISQLDIRGGELSAPRLFGEYGLVFTTISFECHVEQLVNFLADLAKQPELIAPSEQHIAASNIKEKTVTVRMTLAGVVAKKLIPEKKGLGVL